ncbi:uncharacterized protein C11orf16 homolog isoform 2-T2 [Acanthopagrus schlegelii]
MQHHFCGGQLREHEARPGVSETPADPDTADKGFTQGLSVQHHDILRPGEVGLTAHYITNILKDNLKSACWSPHMLPCAPDTVYMALSWIHSISCSHGRDLLSALSVALTDAACHAVHLICTNLPDRLDALLTALPVLAAGRPVNIFYLLDPGGQLDRNTQHYLQCLMQATGGSCYVIAVGLNGGLEKGIPLYIESSQSTVPTLSSVKCRWPSTSVSVPHNTSAPLLRCSLGNPLRPVTSCMLSGQTLRPEFFPGCRVLARREVDGFYYMGTVIQQVQSRGGVWVVEFDHPGSTSLGVVSSQKQMVCSLDMVNHTGAHTRCLVPGDAVLSPWEPDLKRYGPGRVMAATERRDVDGVRSLRVLMWNNCVSLVPGTLVLPISAPHHDRIVRELQITTLASGRCCSWLCARSSSCTPQLLCRDWCQSSPHCCSVTNHRPCSCRSSSGRLDGFERADNDTDVRKCDPEVPSSSSSCLSVGETRVTSPPAVKLRSKEQRPPWRYWRRTGSEPQHRQPGSAVPKRTSQPVRFSFPVPQISASPNHSSMFQPLPGAKGRRANIRDVLGMTNFKPRPPAGLRPFSGISTSAVCT